MPAPHPAVAQAEALPFELRFATGEEVIADMHTPASIEERTESIMALGRQIGIDEARRVVSDVKGRHEAILRIFGKDNLSPQARAYLHGFVNCWMATSENWNELMGAYGATIGKSVDEILAIPAEDAARAANEEVTAVHGPQDTTDASGEDTPRVLDPSDAEDIPLEGRLGQHVHDMDGAAGDSGEDESGTFYLYQRFKPKEG